MELDDTTVEAIAADEFVTVLDRGMRRVPENERSEFDAATTEALNRRLDEFDRVRARGARDVRFL